LLFSIQKTVKTVLNYGRLRELWGTLPWNMIRPALPIRFTHRNKNCSGINKKSSNNLVSGDGSRYTLDLEICIKRYGFKPYYFSMQFELSDNWQEAFKYRPGQKVYVKYGSHAVDSIVSYDPMMVPPIVLANDPMPRYPEELELVTKPQISLPLSPVSLLSRARAQLSA